MKSLGVDLASQPSKTGIALLEWGSRVSVRELRLGATDDEIAQLAEKASVGIDAPFGWPDEFVSMIGGAPSKPWSDAYRDALRFRATDLHVREIVGRWPLSVSSDLIGVVAFRCRGLRVRLDDAHEVYPALALKRWSLPSESYKGTKGKVARARLAAAVVKRAPWLALSSEQRALIEASDDVLDALIAALIARAQSIGAVEAIPPPLEKRAVSEGWIVVPSADALERLNPVAR